MESMRNTKNGFVVEIAVAIIAVVLGSGIYFYIYSQNKEARLQAKLASAQATVTVETAKLESLSEKFQESYPLHLAIQAQCAKMEDIIRKTDVLFNNSETPNPQIKIKTKTSAIKVDINASHARIFTMLNECKKKAADYFGKEVSASTIDAIKRDASLIKLFADKLTIIVNALTRANSGLSQFEIDNYLATLLNASEEISNVIASLESLTLTTEQAPIVILQEIQAQTGIVTEASAQVTLLQAELVQVQLSNQQSTTTASGAQGTQGENFLPEETSIPSSSDSTVGEIPLEPIIIQPGPPELIQGSNRF